MDGQQPERIDLGHDVQIVYESWGVYPKVGLIEYHRTSSGEECVNGIGHSVLFDLPGVADAFPGAPLWEVDSFEPLTLRPSLLCRVCGHHGFITGGRWVPA